MRFTLSCVDARLSRALDCDDTMGGRNIGVGATILSLKIGGAGGCLSDAMEGCGNNMGGNFVASAPPPPEDE